MVFGRNGGIRMSFIVIIFDLTLKNRAGVAQLASAYLNCTDNYDVAKIGMKSVTGLRS